MQSLSRRNFLKKSGMATSLLVSPVATRTLPAASPNDTINVAVIGIRRRGVTHYRQFLKLPNVRVATICDVDERLFPEALNNIAQLSSHKPKTETDLRRVLDDKDVDVVSIVTPDHWHALASIWSCQAGKDVCVEKPCSHNIWEGRKMVEAARKYNRIVQVSTHNRSSPVIQAGIKFLHEGGIGDVYMARCLCFNPRESIGRKGDSSVPPGVHYDLWLGPAPARPFNENRFHYNWHWFWDYGTADMGNQGSHDIDVARWGLNRSDYPVKIKCAGGHYAFDDDQETPNVQIASMEFSDGKILQFEVRGLYTNSEDGVTLGNLFYGTKGWMHLKHNGTSWKTYFGRKNEPGPGMTGDVTGDDLHFANFIQAVRSRNRQELNQEIEQGHISTTYCHLGNISYRVGREVRFDGSAERFIDDAQANELLTRKYRKPYVVPERV